MVPSINRRSILGVLAVLLTGGCLNGTSGEATDASDAVEKGGFELADIQPQALESYVGITAIVYNDSSKRGTVTVQFTAYDESGDKLHEGTDSVSVDSGAQAPISMYWEKNPDNSPFQGWDAKIVSVE